MKRYCCDTLAAGPVGKLEQLAQRVEQRVEDEVEADEPHQVVGHRQLQQPLRRLVHVHRGEGHEGVDHRGCDVLQ